MVWQSVGSSGDDSSDNSIQAQRFAADGSVSGDEFQANTYTDSFQILPAVSAGGGIFAVSWLSAGSNDSDDSGTSIQSQLLRADGSFLDGETQINSFTTSTQRSPAVSAHSNGDFVVVWDSQGSPEGDSSGYSVQGRRSRGALLFADGFETGNVSAWSASVGGP